jgi:hypothetical protein
MPLYRALTVIRTADNIVANYATNSTYWVDGDTSQLDDVTLALRDSYDEVIAEFSTLMAQNNHVVKFYDLEDPEPRAPVYEGTFNLTSAPSGAPLPPECSMCVSFQGNRQSGQPQARRRGRNFLPFLDNAAVGTDGRLDAAAISAGIAWGQNLLDYSATPGAPTWVVNSTYGEPLEFTTTVTNGWVDNEVDTQRRRGRVATSRSTFS